MRQSHPAKSLRPSASGRARISRPVRDPRQESRRAWHRAPSCARGRYSRPGEREQSPRRRRVRPALTQGPGSQVSVAQYPSDCSPMNAVIWQASATGRRRAGPIPPVLAPPRRNTGTQATAARRAGAVQSARGACQPHPSSRAPGGRSHPRRPPLRFPVRRSTRPAAVPAAPVSDAPPSFWPSCSCRAKSRGFRGRAGAAAGLSLHSRFNHSEAGRRSRPWQLRLLGPRLLPHLSCASIPSMPAIFRLESPGRSTGRPTGARRISFPGSEHTLTHSDVWAMERLPRSVAVVGGYGVPARLRLRGLRRAGVAAGGRAAHPRG